MTSLDAFSYFGTHHIDIARAATNGDPAAQDVINRYRIVKTSPRDNTAHRQFVAAVSAYAQTQAEAEAQP